MADSSDPTVHHTDDHGRQHLARRLAGALEAFAGQVYFSPECHLGYSMLGFEPSPAVSKGVELPDRAAYFTSRGALLGHVPGQVVAAAFGVFNPEVVVPAVEHGWSLTDADTIAGARHDGAVAQLARLLGDEPAGLDGFIEALDPVVAGLGPEGKPLFAGLSARERPASSLGVGWWLADQLREYRGDVHNATWVSAGFSAIEIGLLTELYWGLPARSYSRSRGWTDPQFDAAEAGLTERGLMLDGALTAEGRSTRELIEVTTDARCHPILDGLGDAFDDVVSLLEGWSATIRDGFGYPAAGPHDLADRAR